MDFPAFVVADRIVGWWELNADSQSVRWTAFEPLEEQVLAGVEQEALAAYHRARTAPAL